MLWLLLRHKCLLVLTGCKLLPADGHAQNSEPDSVDRDYTSELPRVRPVEAKDALETFAIANGPQYLNHVLITTDGRSLTGMIAAETATSVTLKPADSVTDTILRIEIEEMRSTGVSLMPDGVEK